MPTRIAVLTREGMSSLGNIRQPALERLSGVQQQTISGILAGKIPSLEVAIKLGSALIKNPAGPLIFAEARALDRGEDSSYWTAAIAAINRPDDGAKMLVFADLRPDVLRDRTADRSIRAITIPAESIGAGTFGIINSGAGLPPLVLEGDLVAVQPLAKYSDGDVLLVSVSGATAELFRATFQGPLLILCRGDHRPFVVDMTAPGAVEIFGAALWSKRQLAGAERERERERERETEMTTESN